MAKRLSTGCSTRHSGHQLPQTLSTYGVPSRSLDVTSRPGSCSSGRVKSGAGLSNSGEGRASRSPRPDWRTPKNSSERKERKETGDGKRRRGKGEHKCAARKAA